jgi:DNA-binding PadR family transcriptional regulator
MGKGILLGEFEILVLGAVLRLTDSAYGVSVRQEIERRTGRPTSIGAVYATLDRLEQKGYVVTRVSEPRPVPGGRARKFFRLTAAGARSLAHARRALDRMFEGLELEPGR